MPVPLLEANDSFIGQGTDGIKGQIDVVHLSAALGNFFSSFYLPHPARLARKVVKDLSLTDFVKDGQISFDSYLQLLLRHNNLLPAAYRDELRAAVREIVGEDTKIDDKRATPNNDPRSPRSPQITPNSKNRNRANSFDELDSVPEETGDDNRNRTDSDVRFDKLMLEVNTECERPASVNEEAETSPVFVRAKSDLSLFIDELEAAVITECHTPTSSARRADRAVHTLVELNKKLEDSETKLEQSEAKRRLSEAKLQQSEARLQQSEMRLEHSEREVQSLRTYTGAIQSTGDDSTPQSSPLQHASIYDFQATRSFEATQPSQPFTQSCGARRVSVGFNGGGPQHDLKRGLSSQALVQPPQEDRWGTYSGKGGGKGGRPDGVRLRKSESDGIVRHMRQ